LEICKRLGIHRLIATKVDIHSGNFLSENCYGNEKVKRFRQAFSEKEIGGFYSDSESDLPMARIAEHAYLVVNNRLIEWNVK
jgi:phosphoserine phosphatase